MQACACLRTRYGGVTWCDQTIHPASSSRMMTIVLGTRQCLLSVLNYNPDVRLFSRALSDFQQGPARQRWRASDAGAQGAR